MSLLLDRSLPSTRPWLRELLLFGVKEARACLFPALFVLALALSRVVPTGPLARYDFIFLLTLAIQVALLWLRIESVQEALVLAAFHALGLVLELFKTHPAVGSWSYPEPSVLRIATVPLYSGFMYAAVASYMCQAWRLLQLELSDYPSYRLSVPLCVVIYLNFFTHHFLLPDLRWVLLAGVVALFWRTRVHFTVTEARRRMPLLLAFGLIGWFVWVAENLSTFFGAWAYPNQLQQWALVAPGKISSWILLVIVSFLIVADLKHVRARRGASTAREIPDGARARL